MRAHGAAAVDKDLLGHGHDRYGRWCIESSVNVRIIEQFNGGSRAAVPPAARPTAPAARTSRGGARLMLEQVLELCGLVLGLGLRELVLSPGLVIEDAPEELDRDREEDHDDRDAEWDCVRRRRVRRWWRAWCRQR